jgi:hypothetical protein
MQPCVRNEAHVEFGDDREPLSCKLQDHQSLIVRFAGSMPSDESEPTATSRGEYLCWHADHDRGTP